MPRTIRTSGDYAIDRELDALWRAVEAIKRADVSTSTESTDVPQVIGVRTVAEFGSPGVDGHITLSEGDAILIDQADRDFKVSVDLCDDTPHDIVGKSGIVVPELVETFTDEDGTILHVGGHLADTGQQWQYARSLWGPAPGPYVITSGGRSQHQGFVWPSTTAAILGDPLVSAVPSMPCQMDFDFMSLSGKLDTNVAMLCTHEGGSYPYWNTEGVYIELGWGYGDDMDEWGIQCLVPGTDVDGDSYKFPYGPLTDTLHHATIYHAPEGANYRVKVSIDGDQLLDFAYQPYSGLGARNRIAIEIRAQAPTTSYVDNIVVGQVVDGGASAGTALVPSRCDHTHLGVRSLRSQSSGGLGSQLFGNVLISENGGLDVGQNLDSNKITLAAGWRRSFLIG